MDEPTIEDLILMGVIEVAAFDPESEEMLYRFTDKAKEIFPELYDQHINTIHDEIMYFWERGFLNISDLEAKNPIVTLNDKAFDKDAISLLPPDKQLTLMDIKRILKVV